jgi:hypothetical protein
MRLALALAQGRNELATPLFDCDGWRKGWTFNKGNLNKCRAEIIREIRSGAA